MDEKNQRLVSEFEELDDNLLNYEKAKTIEEQKMHLQNGIKNIETISSICNKINEEIDEEEKENKEKKETIINEKKSTNKKNLALIKIIAIFLVLVAGVYFYKKMPKNFIGKEKINVANPNDLKIQDSLEQDENKKFLRENGIEDIESKNFFIKDSNKEDLKDNQNQEKEQSNGNLNENNSNKANVVTANENHNDKLQKDYDELDRAIEELESPKKTSEDPFEELERRSTRANSNDGLAFIRKNKNNDSSEVKSKNSNKGLDRYFIDNNKKEIEDRSVIERKNKLINSFNDFEVKQGSVIPAIFLTEVNTDLPGDVLAQVRENVYDSKTGNYLLIPKGSRLYGRYESNVNKNQRRVFVIWDKLILPNGKYIELTEFNGTDILGNSGVEDKTNNHTISLIGKALLSSVLNFTDTLASGVSFNVNGLTVGLSGKTDKEKNSSPFKEVTSHLVKREVERKPTLTIRRGYKFNIIVNGDLELEKYKY